MPFQQPEYWEEHRALVEKSKPKRKKKSVAKREAEKKRATAGLSQYSESQIRSEIMRRRYKKRMAKMTPEARRAEIDKMLAVKRIKAALCDHKKLKPKLRKKGKYAGQWCCPSCLKPVPAPTSGEEIVV